MGSAQAQNGEFYLDDDAIGAAEATQQALIDTQQRLGMMLDIMPMGLLIHTEQGILFGNQEACRMLGVRKEELVGQHVLDFVDPTEFDAVMNQLQRSFAEGAEVINKETLLSAGDGPPINIKLISARLPWAGTPVIQVLFQDVSDLKLKEQSLERLSTTDELTGAFNRRHVFAIAADCMENASVSDRDLSVLLLDVDHFKKINDSYGHGLGDQALIALARCGAEAVGPEKGVFARIGGEEFLVLLPGLNETAAAAVGEKLRKSIGRIEIPTNDGALRFSISVGVATRSPEDTEFGKIVARADEALYEAKNTGRNRVVVAH
ncbi:PAS domain S-box-containing protein/diguanylate cyclase (GGDEF)-like protein [Hoeflea halophila]|uniref:diguanylate cyclase n=1 Tax=Hoeflea halophila TaxID=714899 RepID=A0A286IBR0_9HYPH|nr:sensor domain-containing diguanylate cyclase [Hoeflea halophila]SOE17540.1 PAS domain S-box-containing protein/diguanylate cyclase (GGDEF)-like protein [Hoeflea halophila]